MGSGSRSLDERCGVGVPRVIGSLGDVPLHEPIHHPVGSAELDRKVDHWPYGHSSGRTRIVREEAGTVPGMEQVSRVVHNPEFEWHMEVPPVGKSALTGSDRGDNLY